MVKGTYFLQMEANTKDNLHKDNLPAMEYLLTLLDKKQLDIGFMEIMLVIIS